MLGAQEPDGKIYLLRGGRWFDGTRFVERSWYSVGGRFESRRPARVDSVIDLAGRFIIAPFGDAHTHAFDSPATIAATVAGHLREGVFYALSLTNSVAGKFAVAAAVNTPASVDVGFADAGLTSTFGHPIMSAEMAANRWRWDSLGAYWSRLLQSRRAEGDAYFRLDSLPDLERQWDRIRASRPDLLKIYLLDSERHAERRGNPQFFGSLGLDPALVPAIVAAAHRDGRRVAAHIETAADFRVAVAAGVDLIAHLPGTAIRSDSARERFLITSADARLAAGRKVVVIPTAWLATQERIAGGDTAQIRRTREVQRRNLTALVRAGVPIAIGSDLFVTALHEARYLLDLGVFGPVEVLRMWTQTTPRAIFPDRRLGRLEAGHEASLLALECNPLEAFDCTGKIRLRLKQGRVVPGY